MKRTAHIWVRRTLDWADREAFEAQLEPEFRGQVELWDRTFNLPYNLFRHRVREIARLNLSRVEGATVSDWDRIPDGALVLPVDDDDWFAPGIVAALEGAMEPGDAGCHWRMSWVESHQHWRHRLHLWKRRLAPWAVPQRICFTNNYALVKRPGIRWLLLHHHYATEWLQGGGGEMPWIDRRLNASNRTIASQTSLRRHRGYVTERELLGKYRRYRRLYDAYLRQWPQAGLPRAAPPEWSRPYVELMDELMRELEPF